MTSIVDRNDSLICPGNTTLHVNISSGMTLLVVYIVVISLNSLILFVIFGVKHRSLRWSLDYLVSFLAITDLVSTLVGLPIPIVAYLQGYWPGSCLPSAADKLSEFNVTCKVFFLFVVWGRLSTMFIITMMCMERFLAITKPFVHREMVTAGRLRRCVYVIWIVMFIYSVLPLVNVGHVSLHWNRYLTDNQSSEPPYFFCFIDYTHASLGGAEDIANLVYSIIFLLFGFVTLVIVLFCVFFICRILLVRRPQIRHSIKKTKSTAADKYSANGSTTDTDVQKVTAKPSILQRSRTFIAKRRPAIKKFEPEELQFIALMLMIAGIFYCTFLPTMLLVLCNIIKKDLGETYTFWAMRLTSFVTIANPMVYGLSNKLYRIGCIWVFKSIINLFRCRRVPVPERLGLRRSSTSRCPTSTTFHQTHTALTNAEKIAQEFIIAASPNKETAMARTFVGKFRRANGPILEERDESEVATNTHAVDIDSCGVPQNSTADEQAAMAKII